MLAKSEVEIERELQRKVQVHPYDKVLLRDTTHEVISRPGGYGSAKTTTAAIIHHHRAYTYNHNFEDDFTRICRSYWLAPDMKTCFIGFRKYVEVLEWFGFRENIHFKTTRSSSNLSLEYQVFPHIVEWKSARQLNQGEDITHLTVDEAADCRDEAIGNCRARLRDKRGRLRQTFLYGAPQGLDHFHKRALADDMQAFGKYHQFLANDSKLCLNFRTYWNPFVDLDYLKVLFEEYGHDEAFMACWVFGLFHPMGSKRCFRFIPTKQLDGGHLSDRRLDLANKTIYIGWDFNVGMVKFVLLQTIQTHAGLEWHAVAEAPPNLHDTFDACEYLLRHVLDPNIFGGHEIIIDGDANGHYGSTRGKVNDYDIIRTVLGSKFPRLRVIAPHHNTGVPHRIASCNKLFDHFRLYIGSHLRHTIESLSKTSWEDYRTVSKPSGETWTHLAEALNYVVSRQEPLAEKGFVGGISW